VALTYFLISNTSDRAILRYMHWERCEPPRVEQHLALAQVIACEYVNTPNATLDELISEACCALLRAVKKFDSSRGEFEPYAARAIRNALNDFYKAQMRRAAMFPISLDPSRDSTAATRSSSKIADPSFDVVIEARRGESRIALEKVLAELPTRLQAVVAGLRAGKTYHEIGDSLGISKQGVHKLAQPALRKLLERLTEQGFNGVDSKGFLRSQDSSKPADANAQAPDSLG
jgi:RNA polymerase sigma factor (sigma-70 family)